MAGLVGVVQVDRGRIEQRRATDEEDVTRPASAPQLVAPCTCTPVEELTRLLAKAMGPGIVQHAGLNHERDTVCMGVA